MGQVDIVIVNWNGAAYCRTLLGSLREHPERHLLGRVVVVDNGSTDESIDCIAHHHPWVTLVRSDWNRGYAAGNNLGLPYCTADIVILLNNDTVVEDDHFFGKVLATFAADARIGAVGPALVLPDGRLQTGAMGYDLCLYSLVCSFLFLARILPSVSRPFYLDQELPRRRGMLVDVEWVSGAAMALRRDVLKAVGGVPEDYFMYAEDITLCRTIRASGYRVCYLPTAWVVHSHGGSVNAGENTRWITSILDEHERMSNRLSGLVARAILVIGFSLRGCIHFCRFLVGGGRPARTDVRTMFRYARAAWGHRSGEGRGRPEG
jgi:N-acetylglucosaminyl-diphospho-decaprenol L-rhamnosyltransferase